MELLTPMTRSMRVVSRRHQALIINVQQIRTKATAQRQRKSLRVSPDPSFIPSPRETQDHIIYNPPPTPPNVYHTPLKFLPASDPRRKIHMLANPPPSPSSPETASSEAAPVAPGVFAALAQSRLSHQQPSRLPRQMGAPHERKYHLTPEDVEEVRRLRAEDGERWTVKRLAERFDCAQFFIRLCASNLEAKERQDAKIATIKSRWGRGKREAREERDRRKEGWGRGE